MSRAGAQSERQRHAFFDKVHNTINEQHVGSDLRISQEKIVKDGA
jgi:hypothetical protein